MKHRQWPLTAAVILLIGLFAASSLFAGITGKISGVITDSETGDPLPGANILVEGTMLGSASDLQGRFNILNLSPGIYSLKATMMGYQSTVVELVRVKIDLTTKVNFALQQTVLETDEAITVVAERALVQMDMTGSLSAVGADEIDALPVESVSDVLELQAGIVKTGGDLHVRGGRAGEVAYWVDGVATTDVFSGNMGVTIENSAIEELQVVSGTFNAEYGQAMSGIINIVTKEGGKNYSGQVKGYVGDYISNRDEFGVLDQVNVLTDPVSGNYYKTSTLENPLKDLNAAYNGEFSLSGPLPFTREKLTFFANSRYVHNDGYLYGRRWFTPQGLAGDSSLVTLNPYERLSAQAKLTYRLSGNIKVSYNVLWNKWDKDRNFYNGGTFSGHNYKFCPDALPQQHGGGLTHIVSLNHVLSPTTFYEVRLNRFYNEYEQYLYEDPLAAPNYLVYVHPDTALGTEGFMLDLSNSGDAAMFDAVQQERRNYDYRIDPAGPAGYIHPDSAQTPTSYSFYNVGTDPNHYKRSTAYWVGKFDLTSQVTNTHQIKLGAEFRQHELTLNSFALIPATVPGGEEQMVPYQPAIPEPGSTRRDDYVREPREISAYIQDKAEFNDLILNLGVRFDYFDANSVKPVFANDPNIYDPFLAENRYKNPGAPDEELVEYTPDERRSFMHTKVDPKMAVSPRLGIAYPITDQGVIHFSYGHFFQIPEFQYLYANPDFKLNSGGGYGVFGNADLDPQKTVMYEIGLQQQLTTNVGLDVTLFYRDVRDWVGTSALIPTPRPSVQYSQYENKDYENVRGITVKFEKRHSNNFSAKVDYSYQVVEGTYSNPNDAFNAYQSQQEPRLALVPMNWDQRHTANASLIYQAGAWTISTIGRYWTGLPYTPTFGRAEIVGGSSVIGLKENSERRPAQKNIDIILNRRIDLGTVELTFFLNIYNVFDQKDERTVYTDTGTADYTTNIDPNNITYNANRIGTVEHWVLQPTWYMEPRQIQIGCILGF